MSISDNEVTLGLMTKYWESGQVKTRLGETIGHARAAAIHRLLVLDLCDRLSEFGTRRTVCLAPESRREAFEQELGRQRLQSRWDVIIQSNGNIGTRMMHWFRGILTDPNRSAAPAILIGADCPTVSESLLRRARQQLRTHNVVLGPASDGGYYLIGVAVAWDLAKFQAIFDDMPWSTDRVFAETVKRLESIGLSWHRLPEREDIDTVAELNRLRGELVAKPPSDACEKTVRKWSRLVAAIELVLEQDAGFEEGMIPRETSES